MPLHMSQPHLLTVPHRQNVRDGASGRKMVSLPTLALTEPQKRGTLGFQTCFSFRETLVAAKSAAKSRAMPRPVSCMGTPPSDSSKSRHDGQQQYATEEIRGELMNRALSTVEWRVRGALSSPSLVCWGKDGHRHGIVQSASSLLRLADGVLRGAASTRYIYLRNSRYRACTTKIDVGSKAARQRRRPRGLPSEALP
jgi:hypothetical protein